MPIPLIGDIKNMKKYTILLLIIILLVSCNNHTNDISSKNNIAPIETLNSNELNPLNIYTYFRIYGFNSGFIYGYESSFDYESWNVNNKDRVSEGFS